MAKIRPFRALRPDPSLAARIAAVPYDVVNVDEARALLDTIDTTSPVGLRDRALIGLMVYTVARVGAASKMRVKDVYVQGRRTWVRLHEKGGNLIHSDGHAEYKKNVKTSSMDWGLVDIYGKDSPYQPTEKHSRDPYFYR